MNIINRLTLRQMKFNKRRTVVTILGAIVSVAMITAVSTFMTSFLGVMRDQVASNEGDWHVVYNNVPSDSANVILEDSHTEHYTLRSELGSALFPGLENARIPYVSVTAMSSGFFREDFIPLASGRYPENPREIIIPETLLTENEKNVDLGIGDTVQLELGTRTVLDESQGETVDVDHYSPNLDGTNHIDTIPETFVSSGETTTFTVVGTFDSVSYAADPKYTTESGSNTPYPFYSYIDPTDLSAYSALDIRVTEKHPTIAIYSQAEKLAQKAGVPYHDHLEEDEQGNPIAVRSYEIEFHNGLLRFYGITRNDGFLQAMTKLVALFIGIIMIGSVSLIHNTFTISLAERSRYLGMLAGVGATKEQKRRSVFFEGACIGIISIPLGILAGIGGLGVTFLLIRSVLGNVRLMHSFIELRLHVSWLGILIAVVFSLLTIFLSTLRPAHLASKITPIDAIRQTREIKLTAKQVKTSRLTRRLFGFEADLALKNLKRNKRRYRSTVRSLSISLILFLTVSGLTYYLGNAYELTMESTNYDVEFNYYANQEEPEQFWQDVRAMRSITECTHTVTYFRFGHLHPEEVCEQARETDENFLIHCDDEVYQQINVYLYALDDDTLKTYAKACGADINELKQTDNPHMILVNKYLQEVNSSYASGYAIETGHILDLKAGEDLFFRGLDFIGSPYYYPTGDDVTIILSAVTDQLPMGGSYMSPRCIQLYGSEAVVQKLLDQWGRDNAGYPDRSCTYANIGNQELFLEEVEVLRDHYPNLSEHDAYISNDRARQLLLLTNVFGYGFVALMSLVSIANIFNTITTSIALRKREFAMLRSAGMENKRFYRMVRYESAFYGLKAILFGLPISLLILAAMYWLLNLVFMQPFSLPVIHILAAIAAIFCIVGATMLYSVSKLKQDNIVDTLKNENL